MLEKNYFIERATVYQEEAQTGIEYELQGNTKLASLTLKNLQKSISAELANLERKNDYFLFLNDLNSIFQKKDHLFVKLTFIREKSRNYISKE